MMISSILGLLIIVTQDSQILGYKICHLNPMDKLNEAFLTFVFNLKSIHNVNNYVQIFARINRLDQLKKYYYQCEKAKILEKNSFLIAELNSSFEVVSTNPIAKVKLDSNEQQSELLIKLLTNWLDYSIEIWQKEVILLTFINFS